MKKIEYRFDDLGILLFLSEVDIHEEDIPFFSLAEELVYGLRYVPSVTSITFYIDGTPYEKVIVYNGISILSEKIESSFTW